MIANQPKNTEYIELGTDVGRCEAAVTPRKK